MNTLESERRFVGVALIPILTASLGPIVSCSSDAEPPIGAVRDIENEDDARLADSAGDLNAEVDSEEAPAKSAEEIREVYSVTSRGSGDVQVIEEERGVLTPEVRERVRRPWLDTTGHEVLAEGMFGGRTEDGEEVAGYTVVGIPIEPVISRTTKVARHEVGNELRQVVAAESPQTLVDVVVYVELSEPVVALPRLPHRLEVDVDTYNQALAARTAAAKLQVERFRTSVAPVASAIAALGGRVTGVHSRTRTLTVQLPVAQVDQVAELEFVDRVLQDNEPRGGANVPLGWDSDGSNVGLRDANHIGAVSFGYNGENGSSAPLRIGVTEAAAIEDEACMGDDGSGCTMTERLKRKYICDGSSCTTTSNYSTTRESEEGGHGTIVTSILGASYHQSQTNPNGTGEPSLDSDWRDLATGVAYESEIDFVDYDTTTGLANAYDCLAGDTGAGSSCRKVDVVNSSIGYTSFCSLTSNFNYELALEHMWDDNVLPVVIAHNSPSGTSCRVMSPGDTPMAFTVGALNGTDTSSYDNWGMASYSPYGGASGTFGSTFSSGTITVIDLVAAGDMTYVTTRPSNGNGTIDPSYSGSGTSFAAPQVAGAATLIKDWRLDLGHTWINNTGFLYAHLLAMGDRYTTGNAFSACISGNRLVCGGDTRSGFGRLKLQQPSGAWSWAAYGLTFTGTSSSDTFDFSFPIPSGSEIVKCAMIQREPMENKSNYSQVGLHIRIRDKVGGACVADSGTERWHRFEALADVKHMVAVLDSETNIEDKCADVDLDPVRLSSDGYVTAYAYCYTNNQLDDEPN